MKKKMKKGHRPGKSIIISRNLNIIFVTAFFEFTRK